MVVSRSFLGNLDLVGIMSIKRVIIDDPSIWEFHVKDNIEWAKFKKDRFLPYSELCIVFTDTYATGDQTIESGQNLTLSDDGNNYEDDGNDFVEGFDDHHLDVEGFTPPSILVLQFMRSTTWIGHRIPREEKR